MRPAAPRLHDLRHTFAVRTLLGWYRAGEDVQAKIPSLSTYLGHREPSLHLLVSVGRSGAARAGRRPPGHRVVGGPVMTLIAPTLQAFFTDRLAQQRQASPRTIAAYRDTLRLLLGFVHQPDRQDARRSSTGTTWTPTMISAFLNHLETERHNSIRTRNVRLTAIRSLFSYAALRHPEHAAAHPARPGHPTEAVRQADRDVPDRAGGRRPASPPRTSPAGKADATGPSCCWPSRPACGSPNSPA